MIKRSTRTLSIFTVCWAVPYIVSKIDFAIEGKLGIHFGPTIYPSDYASYDGPAAVSAGQWSNAVIGTAFLLISLIPATPLMARINRWIVAVPLFAIAAFQASFGGTCLYRAVTTERGGAIFGVFLLIWAAALVGLAISVLRDARRRTDPPASAMFAAAKGSR